MAKLKPGSVTIDLETGGIYGDVDHCPVDDLLESAAALLSLLPKVEHKGLWGLLKDFDAGCYLYTTVNRYELNSEDYALEVDIYRGPGGMEGPWTRPFRLTVMAGANRDRHWRYDWYSRLIGSVKDGQVSRDIQGIHDVTAEQRAAHERWLAEIERRRPPVQTTLNLV